MNMRVHTPKGTAPIYELWDCPRHGQTRNCAVLPGQYDTDVIVYIFCIPNRSCLVCT